MIKKSKSRYENLNLNIQYQEPKKKYKGTGRTVPRPFDQKMTAEIYPLSEAR
jgi:hypothetical protein